MAIQVIQREKLDTSGASSAIQNMAKVREIKEQAEMKRAQMKYYSDELALRAKQSDNEVEKARLQEKSDRFKVLSNVFGEAVKSGDPQKTLMTHFSLFPEAWEQVGQEEDFKKRISGLEPSGDQQLNQEVAQMLRNRRLGNSPDGSGQITPGNRSGVMDGEQPVLTQIGPAGPTFEFPQAKALGTALDTSARKSAERAEALKPVQRSAKIYFDTFDSAVKEMGGLSTNQAGAYGKSALNTLQSKIGNKPATQVLNDTAKAMAVELAVLTQGSKPTDKDAEAMAGRLLRLDRTEGSNKIIRRLLEATVKGDEGAAGQLYNAIATPNTNKRGRFSIQEVQ